MAEELHYYVAELMKRDVLDQSNDPNIGSARGDNNTKGSEALGSLGLGGSAGSALLSTLVPALLFAIIWIVLFIICRKAQHQFYAPKSYLGHIHELERSPELPTGWLNWFADFWKLPDSHVLRNSSLDGYLFLRFLKLMSLICFVGCIFTWPVLFPVNITGGAGNAGLDMLSFSNVADPTRYYAHTFVSWVFFGFIFYMVTRESIFYASLRQVYLLSPLYANRISSRTVLFLAIPHSLLKADKLSKLFGSSVKRVWITTDTSDLEKLVSKRDELAFGLEDAETRFIRSANEARLKTLKAQKQKEPASSSADGENGADGVDADTPWALKGTRPTHRLRWMTGKKVDSIEWYRSQLADVLPEVSELQRKHRIGEAKTVSSAFIEFETQTAAQIAYQTLSHHHPFRMTPRFIGIPPEQVVWPALQYSWWQRIIRKFVIQGAITALIIFWSIPSALVGMITNITYLTNLVSFLRWINDLPSVIKGIISGLLPSVALALLMALVPPICRWCARQSGLPSKARVELFSQNAHFCFQVVQVFLVTTLTSAASAATTQIIQDPLSAKDLLAKNLPKASNFYLSFFLFQGLVLSSIAVVKIMVFHAYKGVRAAFDKTPRKLYQRWAELNGLSWGNVFPVFTNMVVIAIAYSCIAPLILAFASFALFLVYQAYRYNFIFVYDSLVDTKGLVYPRALQHVLTGIYLAEICMIGLFGIKAALGPLILMVLCTITTALSHISLNDALTPLLNALPRSLDNIGEADEGEENDPTEKPSTTKAEEADAEFQDPTDKTKRTMTTITTCSTASDPPARRGKLSSLADWLLRPRIHADYAILRRKMRRETGIFYHGDVAENAYFPPPVKSPAPLLWVPRDQGGVSQQEVEITGKVIPVTDEEAHLDEKNKVIWDKIGMKPPIWTEKIFY